MNNRLSYTLAAAALIILFAAAMCTHFVRITECAVVTTFGKPVKEITEPGLYWKWPWPVQKAFTFDRRMQNYEGGLDETYTSDGKIILVQIFAGWKIAAPRLFLERIGSIEEARRHLDGAFRNAKNAVIGMTQLSSLISTNAQNRTVEEIEAKMHDMVKQDILNRYGIETAFIGIMQFGLPESITQKVFERMKKERERISERHLAEGEAQAAQIMAQADKEKEEILSKANAQAKRIIGEAQAQAAEAFTIFEKNKELAVFLQKLEALQNTTKKNTTLVIDYSMPPYDLLVPGASITGTAPSAKEKKE